MHMKENLLEKLEVYPAMNHQFSLTTSHFSWYVKFGHTDNNHLGNAL